MKIQKIEKDKFVCDKPNLTIVTFDDIFDLVVIHVINIIYNIYGDLDLIKTLNKDIKKIFDEELEKNCKASPTFKACFENCVIGPLFRNEKKIGAIISKTKI